MYILVCVYRKLWVKLVVLTKRNGRGTRAGGLGVVMVRAGVSMSNYYYMAYTHKHTEGLPPATSSLASNYFYTHTNICSHNDTHTFTHESAHSRNTRTKTSLCRPPSALNCVALRSSVERLSRVHQSGLCTPDSRSKRVGFAIDVIKKKNRTRDSEARARVLPIVSTTQSPIQSLTCALVVVVVPLRECVWRAAVTLLDRKRRRRYRKRSRATQLTQTNIAAPRAVAKRESR